MTVALDRLAAMNEQRKERAPDDAPAFSEDALALAFTRQHGVDLRHVAAWGKWLRWNGIRWCDDSTLEVFYLARLVCREAARASNVDHTAKTLASAKAVAAVERLAKADRPHAATVEQWDADPWLLNTPDGVVDLRTGDLRSHRREDYLTKVTAVGPRGDCPLWRQFLRRITDGDDDLAGFLQRLVGYSLTGSIREHALVFFYGTGANGKSVFLNTVAGIMGHYHTTAPVDLFLDSQVQQHPTGLAGLRGARLVTAIETDEGRRWAEAKIKTLTGGDPISARLMRQDFFEFTPTFKLVIAGNHKPSLSTVDEAIRRRLHLVLFTVTIPPEERDDRLVEKLRAEWPGILAWAIEGAVDWGGDGLRPPASVRDATNDYLEAEDTFAQWIADACMVGPSFTSSASHLFASWKAHCERASEKPGTQRSFSQRLMKKFKRDKTRTGRLYVGICPRPSDDEARPV